jgi:hypothetical protein
MNHTRPRPWADPAHAGNKLRPRVRCVDCRNFGCVTYWGSWCFDCNVPRMDRLAGRFAEIAESVAAYEGGAPRTEGGG